MPMEEEPVVGAFYEDEEGRTFKVLAFDEDLATIEIQYGDGSLNEVDLDAWYGMDLERVQPDERVESEEDADDEEDDAKEPDQDKDEDEDLDDSEEDEE